MQYRNVTTGGVAAYLAQEVYRSRSAHRQQAVGASLCCRENRYGAETLRESVMSKNALKSVSSTVTLEPTLQSLPAVRVVLAAANAAMHAGFAPASGTVTPSIVIVMERAGS